MPTGRKQPGEHTDAIALAEAFTEAIRYLRRFTLAPTSEEHELSPARARTLVAVADTPGIQMGQLAEQMKVTARTVTKLVDSLERDGLVRRAPNAHDRRVTHIELTDAGHGQLNEIRHEHGVMWESAFDALSAVERKRLLGLLRKLTATG
ncbi:MarR family winged helix-turn-helix transcriptional regulator [Amycolatopsis sp. NPDC059657]|uniref:MarR family winged helix-turn-helix transcriptional regulator n=1 Tax=Amycolatopsis sp. NPDC059657 TaxID=3346899 RepID=UPI00366C6E85